MAKDALHLFQGFGIELEYSIVDQDTLAVRPIADRVLKSLSGRHYNEVEIGDLACSNELVLHVIELKTKGPVASLDALAEKFQEGVERINRILAGHNAMLLPGGMHPLMNPSMETRLWPHGYRTVYETYHRIFNCYAHGWANLQSMHINLPFCGDEEFGRLHAAIRLVLPLLPALAASSPIRDGVLTGFCDTRLEVYRTNQSRVPSIAGPIIPEPVFTQRDYRRRILKPMYEDVAPLDPKKVLQHEWLNSRGAIARFMRDTIEIRLIDVQESPQADLAIAAVTVALVRDLVEERFLDYARQKEFTSDALRNILLATICDAETAVIDEKQYLEAFGIGATKPTAGELGSHILEAIADRQDGLSEHIAILRSLIARGCLARRIVRSLDGKEDADSIRQAYRYLAGCLQNAEMFEA